MTPNLCMWLASHIMSGTQFWVLAWELFITRQHARCVTMEARVELLLKMLPPMNDFQKKLCMFLLWVISGIHITIFIHVNCLLRKAPRQSTSSDASIPKAERKAFVNLSLYVLPPIAFERFQYSSCDPMVLDVRLACRVIFVVLLSFVLHAEWNWKRSAHERVRFFG